MWKFKYPKMKKLELEIKYEWTIAYNTDDNYNLETYSIMRINEKRMRV